MQPRQTSNHHENFLDNSNLVDQWYKSERNMIPKPGNTWYCTSLRVAFDFLWTPGDKDGPGWWVNRGVGGGVGGVGGEGGSGGV